MTPLLDAFRPRATQHPGVRATAVGAALAMLGAPAARADTKYSEPTVFNDANGSQCIKGKPSLWHTGEYDNQPVVSGTTSSYTKSFYVNCLLSKRRPGNALLATVSLWVGPPTSASSGGPYDICYGSGVWSGNGHDTYNVTQQRGPWSSPPCGGNRWYRAGHRARFWYDGAAGGGSGPADWYEQLCCTVSPPHAFGAGNK